MLITCDPPKRAYNLKKHKLDLELVQDSFVESAVVQPAKEGRFKALGFLNGAAVAVIFAPLGSEAFSVISLRPARRKERRAL